MGREQAAGPRVPGRSSGSVIIDADLGAMTPDEIEASMIVPGDVADGVINLRSAQDAHRGQWQSPRDARQPDPPWPAENSPMLRFLLWKANASVEAGMDVRSALTQLAVHAWYEGGVENYDLGRRDATR
jgi:hypothetical protein